MSKLAFLSNINLVAQEEPKKKSGGGGARKEWNPPAGRMIRVWRDGSVFPSQELVNFFNLDYRPKPSEEVIVAHKEAKTPLPNVGNGFDVADTNDFPLFVTPTRLLIISPVDRNNGKIDLFGSVTYNKVDDTPTATVMNQGAATFGASFLIPKIQEIYGITFGRPAVEAQEAVAEVKDEEGKIITKARPAIEAQPAVEGPEYVDMILLANPATGEPWSLPEGKTVAFFPKTYSRGENKGEMTIERRESPQMFVFYPQCLLEEPAQEATSVNGTSKA